MLNLDDAMRLLPGLSKLRVLRADMLRILLDRTAKQCTWCGAPVPGRRSKWCSGECVQAFKLRCESNYQRAYVETRDRGICQSCQRDTVAAEKEFKHLLRSKYYSGWKTTEERRAGQAALDVELLKVGYGRGQWREVDHLIPVCLGGGLCREENLRLVCGACHKAATDHLARMRKAS